MRGHRSSASPYQFNAFIKARFLALQHPRRTRSKETSKPGREVLRPNLRRHRRGGTRHAPISLSPLPNNIDLSATLHRPRPCSRAEAYWQHAAVTPTIARRFLPCSNDPWQRFQLLRLGSPAWQSLRDPGVRAAPNRSRVLALTFASFGMQLSWILILRG